jgi:hypothetical protein
MKARLRIPDDGSDHWLDPGLDVGASLGAEAVGKVQDAPCRR